MRRKSTNACLSIDSPVTSAELLDLAGEAGPNIAILEINHAILMDTTDQLPTQLRVLANKHDFLILADW